ncbi:hypothetical protein BCR44DRAFT_1259147 [Catenaria anguillulae PL171]|uniref:Uncharacterized protein n=1 Tax=Catenaria anguillulae PL171 TaxID=765915 RepID=A0A1Y2HD07_9FUNG|nr:hypothetical protein BCR44DRAFT_1259147 [Catenaria anguillulae PL171]
MAYSFQAHALAQSQEVKFSTRLAVYTRQITYYLREATVLPTSSPPMVSADLAKARVLELNRSIDELTNTLVYGNASLEVGGIAKSPFAEVDELLMRNACVAASSPPGCLVFGNGMLASGLVSAMREYNALVTQALAMLNTGGITPSIIFATEPFAALWQLDMTYFPAALSQLSFVYTKKATDGLSEFLRVRFPQSHLTLVNDDSLHS